MHVFVHILLTLMCIITFLTLITCIGAYNKLYPYNGRS